MKQLHLVRHGESASNAGLATDSHDTYGITDLGRSQAEHFAKGWSDAPPGLVVSSRYVRTQETARPFMQRFPEVPHETWDVQEWTQLCPKHYRGTSHTQRLPKVRAYYDRRDPHYCDGEGAESFADLFKRVHAMLTKAEKRSEDVIAMFTHGHFMRAVLWSLLVESHPDTPKSMGRFVQFTDAFVIPNLAMLTLRLHHEQWLPGRLRRLPTAS